MEQRLGEEGRVVLRASGTEPVIRVMVEGRTSPRPDPCATELAEVVKAAALALPPSRAFLFLSRPAIEGLLPLIAGWLRMPG